MATAPPAPLDRRGVVSRHSVRLRAVDLSAPLSVGNGSLGFTADVTGLQTFPDAYPVASRGDGPPGTLLSTQSHWGWHTLPGHRDADLERTVRHYPTARGEVPYVDLSTEQTGRAGGETPLEQWLRGNPHRLDLGRIGLRWRDGNDAESRAIPLGPGDVTAVDQHLDLWTGVLRSRYALRGTPVEVVTACHPDRDAVAIRIRSAGLRDARLGVVIAFPYGSQAWSNAADWTRPEAHRSTSTRLGRTSWLVERVLDDDGYQVGVGVCDGVALAPCGPHRFDVGYASGTGGRDVLDLVVEFSPATGGASARSGAALRDLPGVDEVVAASAAARSRFWESGAALSLDGSTDPRAEELERRVVLSQYLTALHSAGPLPPQETGLTGNSWRGKAHLEMHWWHAAHFPVWGRPELLERSLGWYAEIAPRARDTARRQGFGGARWPKQVGPEGRESPSSIGPFLVWQQPHPIHLAELVWRARRDRATLERFAGVVMDSAAFMADFAYRTERGYALLHPLVPAQESYGGIRARVSNPTFELAYWAWALRIAATWRERLGLAPVPKWSEVADGMVRPYVRDGVYTAIDVDPYTIRTDHPSMLCALGVVPPTGMVDPDVMRATLRDVLADWKWSSTWGWDYPATAMCATRLGEPELAVDALLTPTGKNAYLPNGHNRQTDSLPVYLPGNGGLLTAVAMMAAGWDGSDDAPGFPAASWRVRHEGFVPLPGALHGGAAGQAPVALR